MRNCLVIVLALVMTLTACSCKAELDKTKIAALLASYVLDIAIGKELDTARIQDFAAEWAVDFVKLNANEIPARYRAETLAFATAVIPKLISEWGAKLEDGKVVILGPQGEGDDIDAEVVEFLLAEFEAFHEDYS